MANIKSQVKRNRQNEILRVRNKSVRSEIKTRTRSTLAAAETGDVDATREALRLTQQRIDKAATRGVLKKTTAARHKARLERQVRSLIG